MYTLLELHEKEDNRIYGMKKSAYLAIQTVTFRPIDLIYLNYLDPFGRAVFLLLSLKCTCQYFDIGSSSLSSKVNVTDVCSA